MLEAKNISVFYGHHRALEGVSVRVDRGEICVILGANGAGKSTLLSVIAGLTRAESAAAVAVNGTAITAMKPNRIVEHGIALVPEGSAIFGELTVADNLRLGAYPTRARKEEQAALQRVYKLFPVLSERRRQIARTMSGGEQKMLAIGRALMSNPDILMLDEPSLGLSPLLTTQLFKTLKAIGASGVGILLVEQNANQSLKIADRGYLLENGHIVGEDSAVALANDPAVRRAYLGGDAGGESPLKGPLKGPADMMGDVGQAVPLAGKGAAEIAALAGELAAHAAAVHAAHVAGRRNALRSRAHLGSSAPGDAAPEIPTDAAALSRMAGALAERAAEIHAAHIRAVRNGETARTEAPAPREPATPQTAPAPSELTRMAEAFAREALAGARSSGNDGPQVASFKTPQTDAPAPRPDGAAARDPQASALSTAAEKLAAHAAALHARHVAARREALPIDTDDADAVRVKKKHKNGGKKSKKSHKRCGTHKGD